MVDIHHPLVCFLGFINNSIPKLSTVALLSYHSKKPITIHPPKQSVNLAPYVRWERAQLEYIYTHSAESDGNTGQSDDNEEEDLEAGSRLRDTVSPGAAVEVGAAVVSGSGLAVEAMATQ